MAVQNPPRFRWTAATDRMEVLDPWPDEMWADHPLLAVWAPRWVAVGDGIVTFHCDNDTASYGIAGPGPYPDTLRLVRSVRAAPQSPAR